MTLKDWLTIASLFFFPAADRAASAADQKTSEKILHRQVDVNASVDEVWHAWTTPEGIASFFAPGCKIELEPGGAYEIYFTPDQPPGKRGAEGSKVLSYLPNEMLAFTWGAPPAVMKLREAGATTQVVVRLEPLTDGKTRVHFAQLGFGDGEDWDKYYAYFENAWPRVLSNLQKEFANRETLTKPSAAAAKQTTDGHVKVSTSTDPIKRQDFEMTVPVCVEKLWNALATTDGLKSLGGSDPLVELKPGGRYAFWPQAPNKVMAFVPKQVLATTGSAPPKFPNVRKGGTWGIYFFDPLGPNTTRLRLSVIGWKQGEEWDQAFDYFIRNNPIFLNGVYKQVTQDKAAASEDILRHEAVIDAPVAEVWKAFTTKDGVESWMVAHADIDLRVGGLMRTHYNPKGVLGDDGTIENTILSYEPMHMLSIKATKAPANFPFKDAIKDMWTVLYLDPVGSDKTRVTVVGMGFKPDEQSQKMRTHFDWGNGYTLKKLQERFAKADSKANDAPAGATGPAASAANRATR